MAYPPGKDPFLEDEDDDYSFAGRGKPKASYTTSSGGYNPWEEPPQHDYTPQKTKAEQMQEYKDNSMNRTLESTQRAMASIYDSESVGIATAEELVRQGEQLDNIERKTTQINADMKQTQRSLNSIKSVFGGIKNWWSGGKADEKPVSKEPQGSSRPENAALRDAMDQSQQRPDVHPAMRVRSEDIAGFYDDQDDLDTKFLSSSAMGGNGPGSNSDQRAALGISGQQQQERVSSFEQYDQKYNENLDVMAGGMARLKMLASGLGTEISAQNEQIDNRILPSVERADSNIRNQNRQIKKILGVKK